MHSCSVCKLLSLLGSIFHISFAIHLWDIHKNKRFHARTTFLSGKSVPHNIFLLGSALCCQQFDLWGGDRGQQQKLWIFHTVATKSIGGLLPAAVNVVLSLKLSLEFHFTHTGANKNLLRNIWIFAPKMINGIFSQLMIQLNPRDQLGMTPFH